MNKIFLALIVLGLALVCVAAMTATTIPLKTQQDFERYVAQRGGMQHSQTLPESFLLAGTIARSLQNFWFGSTGFLLLTCGLAGKINYACKPPITSTPYT
jgi:hypothetical protein